jgi:hypothetical protein
MKGSASIASISISFLLSIGCNRTQDGIPTTSSTFWLHCYLM